MSGRCCAVVSNAAALNTMKIVADLKNIFPKDAKKKHPNSYIKIRNCKSRFSFGVIQSRALDNAPKSWHN